MHSTTVTGIRHPEHPEHILCAAAHPDPYPYYAQLALGSPLKFDAERKLWIAASADAVNDILSSTACTVRPAAEPVPRAILGSAAGEVFGHLVRMNDGQRHDAPKLALQRFLAGVPLQDFAARTASLAAQMARGYSGPGASGLRGSALTQWAFDVPVMAVADLLGFAHVELPQVARWMADFVACLSPVATPAQLDAAAGAASNLLDRFAELVAGSGEPGRESSALSKVRDEAREAGWHDARALLCNLVGLLSQTYEATAGLLGNSLVALRAQPGLLGKVVADADLLLPLVQEVSRFDPSIHNTRRFVALPVELCGVVLHPGDAILLVLAAAGRDPLCNPQPHSFILQREDRQVPGFGRGAHQCPGQLLACTLAASALRALLNEGLLPASIPLRWSYRPSFNARIPVFHE